MPRQGDSKSPADRPAPNNSQQPGDSKSTVQRLTDTASSVGQKVQNNAIEAVENSKSNIKQATATAQSVGQNIVDTTKHFSDKTGVTAAGNQAAAVANAVGNQAAAVGQNVKDKIDYYTSRPAYDDTKYSTNTLFQHGQQILASAIKAIYDYAENIASSGHPEK